MKLGVVILLLGLLVLGTALGAYELGSAHGYEDGLAAGERAGYQKGRESVTCSFPHPSSWRASTEDNKRGPDGGD